MDIDLLSKMVKELILDNDKVVLPGFGAFVAEIVPSTFSDKGYTINPPYRKLYFRARAEEDTMLVKFYAESNKVELVVADKVVRDFITELKTVLFARKTVIFPGLGRLRATKENAVFFVADEDMDIYPEGFGLEPVSLKTHVETPQEISSAVAQLKAIVDAPVDELAPVEEPETVVEPEEPIVEQEPVIESEPEIELEEVAEQEPEPESEPEPEPESEPEPEPELKPEPEPEPEPVVKPSVGVPVISNNKTESRRMLLIAVIAIVSFILLFFAVFYALVLWAPEYLDTLLYTNEELQILNHR